MSRCLTARFKGLIRSCTAPDSAAKRSRCGRRQKGGTVVLHVDGTILYHHHILSFLAITHSVTVALANLSQNRAIGPTVDAQ